MYCTSYDPVAEIKTAKEYYDNKVKELEELTYITNTMRNNWISSIKSLSSVYNDEWLSKAQSQMKEKYKKDRPQFESLKYHIEFAFTGVDKVKIISIVQCGYDGYGYLVEFIYKNKEYAIFFPIRKQLTSKNVEYAYNGMFSLSKKIGISTWKTICSSYEEDDIKNAFQKDLEMETEE